MICLLPTPSRWSQCTTLHSTVWTLDAHQWASVHQSFWRPCCSDGVINDCLPPCGPHSSPHSNGHPAHCFNHFLCNRIMYIEPAFVSCFHTPEAHLGAFLGSIHLRTCIPYRQFLPAAFLSCWFLMAHCLVFSPKPLFALQQLIVLTILVAMMITAVS